MSDPQVVTEKNGRYTEIYIENAPVKDGSIAYDERENELIVAGEVVRHTDNGAVVDLSEATFE